MGSNVLLVGCGNMGRALLNGWLDQGVPPADLSVVEPAAALAAGIAGSGVTVVTDAGALSPGFRPDVVVLAVKPQVIESVASAYAAFAAGDTVFLSIAAGKTIRTLQERLDGTAAIVRAMPNTPAAVRSGVTVACANERVDSAQRAACDRLLSAIGSVHWVDDEKLLDPVTAVSGSGPAYVFLLAECLAKAAENAGLPPQLATILARETVTGAGALLAQSDLSPATLRENVTSPGGTTAAALAVLMQSSPDLEDLMRRAVLAATARSRELAG